MKKTSVLSQKFDEALFEHHMSWVNNKGGFITFGLTDAFMAAGVAVCAVGYRHEQGNPLVAAGIGALLAGVGILQWKSLTHGHRGEKTPAGYANTMVSHHYLIAGDETAAKDIARVDKICSYIENMTRPYKYEGILPGAVEKNINRAMNLAAEPLSRLRAYKWKRNDTIDWHAPAQFYEYPENRVTEFEFTRGVRDSEGNYRRLPLARFPVDTLSETPDMPRAVPNPKRRGNAHVDTMLELEALLSRDRLGPMRVQPAAEADDAPPSTRPPLTMKVR